MSAQPTQCHAAFSEKYPHRAFLGLMALAMCLHHACASSNANGNSDDPSQNAEQLYNQAIIDLDDGLYPEAMKGFSDVKAQYPYTKYAALADVRTADTSYKQGKWVEAIDAYRNFLRYHPNHEEAPYAMLQIGEANYQQMPGDWWFMPPSEEKDQGSTRLAISAYNDMIARFPKNRLTAKARERLQEGRRRLAEHEMYVARFYRRQAKFAAAAGRAEGLLASYTGLGYDEEALSIAAESRIELGELDKARQHLRKLSKDFPTSEQGKQMEQRLIQATPRAHK